MPREGSFSGILVRVESGNQKEAVAHRRREIGWRALQWNGWSDVGPERHAAFRCARRIGGGKLREKLHVLEDGAQLDGRDASSLLGNPEPREGGNVAHFVQRDAHAPISRSRFACATTNVLRPIDSSSKSTLAFNSRPEPDSSAMVPAPNFRWRTRAPTSMTAAS